MNVNHKAHAAIVSLLIIGFSACDVRRLPGFNQAAKREEERITKETEEAIKQSAELQDLDHLCTQVVPRPDGFVPVNKFRTLHGPLILGYGYHSSVDYQIVKRFLPQSFRSTWVASFSTKGWWLGAIKDRVSQ
jgi:hypothetical protein